MDLGAAISGVKRFAIPSIIVGIVTLVLFLYAVAMSAEAGSDAMNSFARMVVIGGAVAQFVLVVALLIPGTSALRGGRSLNPVRRSKAGAVDEKQIPMVFIWFAVGEAGGLFVFISALLGLFVFGVFEANAVTIGVTLCCFALYAACFVFCIILPLARANALQNRA